MAAVEEDGENLAQFSTGIPNE